MKTTTDPLDDLESGSKYVLNVPGLGYGIFLPRVVLRSNGQRLRIASLNLVGRIRLNQDLGLLIAGKIRDQIPDLSGVVFLTAVEKALQLTQVVAHALGVEAVAVAYNRVKPHMEPGGRPVVRMGSGSITSGDKTLVLYERDINLLCQASRGIVIIDDVVSTGETVLGLVRLAADAHRCQKGELPVLGVFCVAREGRQVPHLPAPLYSLATLPEPELLSG